MLSIAAVVDPPEHGRLPNQSFLNIALGSNPNFTGWPMWLDSRGFSDRTGEPE
jgi:hypothetical protein